MKESLLAVAKSSNVTQDSYIPVVNVDTLKNDTVPKSERTSIVTKVKPTKIEGLAIGKIIFKKVFFNENPRFFPTSNKLLDLYRNAALDKTKIYPNNVNDKEIIEPIIPSNLGIVWL